MNSNFTIAAPKIRKNKCDAIALALAVSAAIVAPPMTLTARAQAGPTAAAEDQQAAPSGAPLSWVDKAVQHELAMMQQTNLPLRYRMRKFDRKGDTTRVVIESEQGSVARLVERNGQSLSASEDAAERDRLNAILSSPDDFLKRKRRNDAGRDYASQLIRSLPAAMLYSYTPGQPQPRDAKSPQIVIDFHPNPAFHPPTMITEALTGLAGRAWIDEATGNLTRLEGHVLRPVNFGWGMIARVYPGGTVEFEQTCIDGQHWVSSHMAENLTTREMMLRTVNDKTRMTAWNFELLPAPLSFQNAVHELLNMQIPLRSSP